MKPRALVCIDVSSHSEWVADEAADLARATGAALVLLNVARGSASAPADAASFAEATEHVEALVARLRGDGLDVTGSVELTEEPVADFILRKAGALGATYLVVGSHARTRLYEAFIGSVTMAVIRASTITVVVAPPRRTIAGPA